MSEHPLRDHADVGTDIGRRHQHDILPLPRRLANGNGNIRGELLDKPRIGIEFDDLALGVALEALVKCQIPAIAHAQHLQHAVVGEVTADLLRDPHPDMFGHLLGTPNMRRDLCNGLEDEMKVSDRDALGQQQLEDRLQARIGNLGRADVLDETLVLGIQPVQQCACVLVRQQLREVVADDFAQVREQDRDVVGDLEAVPFDLFQEGFRDPHRLHAEGRLDRLVARYVRLPVAIQQHQDFADAKFVVRHDRAVDLDPVGLRPDRKIVGEFDLGNDEAVLQGKAAPDLADAMGEFAVRVQHPDRQLAADAELDVGGLQVLLDRVFRLGLRAFPVLRGARPLLYFFCSLPAR